jgi:phosphoglycerate dehydrogenase-like enzyme
MTLPSQRKIRVLSQLGDADGIRLPADLRERVEVIYVPPDAPLPAELSGDILLMTFGNRAIYTLVERGVTWVHFVGTGINGFDLQRLAAGRLFTNSRGSVEVPISEWVLAVLLHQEKRLAEMFIQQPPAVWPLRTVLGTLHGKKLALLGLGAIGAGIARRAQPFGVSVRALRRSSAPSPVPGVELVSTFRELVADADYLVLAAPLTAATRHILNEQSFAFVKPGLHLVNIARGELVDDDALRAALDRGIVAAASLDAVTPEPLPAGHWFYQHPKVHLSPHISYSWPGAFDTVRAHFVANLRRYIAGQPLENLIDIARGY